MRNSICLERQEIQKIENDLTRFLQKIRKYGIIK